MRGRITDMSISLSRKQRLTIEVDEDCRELYDRLKGCDINIEIKKWHNRRSLEANAKCWVMVHKIAEALQLNPVDVYRDAIRDIAGVSEVVCVKKEAADRLCMAWENNGLGWQADRLDSKLKGCVNVVLYYGSSTYDTKQMAALIERLIEECKIAGVEHMPPEEVEALLGQWGSQREARR